MTLPKGYDDGEPKESIAKLTGKLILSIVGIIGAILLILYASGIIGGGSGSSVTQADVDYAIAKANLENEASGMASVCSEALYYGGTANDLQRCNTTLHNLWQDYCNPETKIVPKDETLEFCTDSYLQDYMIKMQIGPWKGLPVYTNENMEGNPNCEKSGAGYICRR